MCSETENKAQQTVFCNMGCKCFKGKQKFISSKYERKMRMYE